jgi:hypothetical protein
MTTEADRAASNSGPGPPERKAELSAAIRAQLKYNGAGKVITATRFPMTMAA